MSDISLGVKIAPLLLLGFFLIVIPKILKQPNWTLGEKLFWVVYLIGSGLFGALVYFYTFYGPRFKYKTTEEEVHQGKNALNSLFLFIILSVVLIAFLSRENLSSIILALVLILVLYFVWRNTKIFPQKDFEIIKRSVPKKYLALRKIIVVLSLVFIIYFGGIKRDERAFFAGLILMLSPLYVPLIIYKTRRRRTKRRI